MGTPDFSVVALKAILQAGHDVLCVYSQPPRKSGRGQKLHLTPVHEFARSQGIEVRTPTSLKDETEQQAFADLNCDLAVVVAYGLILPPQILAAPQRGCINIHASLLPRWRGAAPIQRAIEAGDEQTGVTTMQMDAGLDTGAMLLSEAMPIPFDMNAQDLHDALSEIGGRLIIATLAGLIADQIQSEPQPSHGITYAHKINKAETHLNWKRPAAVVAHQIRAFFPMAWFTLNDQRVRVLAVAVSTALDAADTNIVAPGTTVDDHLTVACASGNVCLTRLQPAGKGAMETTAFLNGHPVACGIKLE